MAQDYIKEIQGAGKVYVAAHNLALFHELAKRQKLRTAVVTCSDSRVHTNMQDKTSEDDLFIIRNIGNQLVAAKGSVQ